jgi:hypothetical protein
MSDKIKTEICHILLDENIHWNFIHNMLSYVLVNYSTFLLVIRLKIFFTDT